MRTSTSSDQDTPLPIIVAVVAIFLGIAYVFGAGVSQLVAAIVVGGALSAVAMLWPNLAIVLTFIYLALMGDIRRWMVVQAGFVKQDMLLLVGPTVVAVLFATALTGRRTMLKTRTSKLMLALMMLLSVEILNPLQGGLTVGITGALFTIVPMLWFWVGQAWGSSAFLEKLLIRVVVPIAVVASLLGLMQASFGYLHYEAIWFRMTTIDSTRPDMRPFSFFCSWAEYPFYVAIALTATLVPLYIRRAHGAIVLAPLFVIAMLVQSVREAILEFVLALTVLWAVQGRNHATMAGRLVVAGVVAVGVLVLAMTALKDVDVNDQVNHQLQHTADGVVDIENSTAGGHTELMGAGILYGLTHPIGLGTGGPTPAGASAGGFSSEIDFTDVFISCGVGGGLLYLYLIFTVLRLTIAYWRDYRDIAALYALAIMVTQLGHWLAGGLYATAPLTWFAIGSIDRMISLRMQPSAIPAPARMKWRAPRRQLLAANARMK